MRLAYLDCFAGVSGELILGALIDAGLSLDSLRSELARLSIPSYTIEAQPVAVSGFTGVEVAVSSTSSYHSGSLVGDGHSANGVPVPEEPGAHSLSYSDLISGADLPPEVKRRSLAALTLLHDAERSSLPLRPPVSQHDALRDVVLIVAAVSGFALLGVQNVVCSPVNVGGGIAILGQHAVPIPSPTVARILQTAAAPIHGTESNRDLVTPVGAAIVVAMTSSFGPAPAMPVSALGYAMSGVPTAPGLRIILGDLRRQENPARSVPTRVGEGLSSITAPYEAHQAVLLEATLDDTNPQYYDFIVEQLLWQGADDVYIVPAQLKMNRPGVVISVVCSALRLEALCDSLFEETRADSVRISEVSRRTVHSEVVEVPTHWGAISARIGRNSEGRILHVKPDHEQVKRVALKNRVTAEQVYDEVRYAVGSPQSELHQHSGRQRFTPEHLAV